MVKPLRVVAGPPSVDRRSGRPTSALDPPVSIAARRFARPEGRPSEICKASPQMVRPPSSA